MSRVEKGAIKDADEMIVNYGIEQALILAESYLEETKEFGETNPYYQALYDNIKKEHDTRTMVK